MRISDWSSDVCSSDLLKDSQIARLIGTTKTTIQAVRERSHWISQNIRPRDPVLLGLCSQSDLNATVEKARRAAAKAGLPLPHPPDRKSVGWGERLPVRVRSGRRGTMKKRKNIRIRIC